MADISCDIVVVGAGVLGLCVASELMARGHDVRVVDPGGVNASSVAAGMIAPAFETLLDGGDADRAVLLRDAAGLWPDFAEQFGITLDQTPAEWRGPDADAVLARLRALGFEADRTPGGVVAPSDGRVDAGASLRALSDRLGSRLIAATVRHVRRDGSAWRVETGRTDIVASHIVLATGVARSVHGVSTQVASLIDAIRPIKGQIGWTLDILTDRVLRGPDGYVAPGGAGTLIGATMVEGERGLEIDPAASERLLALARALTEQAIEGVIEWRVGVRGAMADGLPLAGAVGDGLHVALAPRRNGWLLGPMVAQVVADSIGGGGIEGGGGRAAFDPLRFSPRVD